ncbi:MAG TPA: NAD(P)/FAD-dependent oxidoreductase [Tepidisphaeraceae bacterium]|nr:NAD(P)/FAD-dependent oxidoreductase [Tepidisphaeraceae bacterium]
MRASLHIAVVGCGPAGLAAAGLLARRGHAVSVIERAAALRPVGAGLLLQPSGQLALREMGLLDEVIVDAEAIAGLHAVTHRGRDLARLFYGRVDSSLTGYGVHRDDLFQVLYRHAVRHGVAFRLGVTIVGSRQTAREIVAIDDAGDEHGPFDALIAADGARSRLRAADGLGAVVREFPLGAAWFSGHADTVRGKLLQVTRGTRQLIGLLPLGRGRCSFFCALPTGGRAALERRGLPALRAEVVALCPEAAPLMEQLGSMDALAVAHYQIAQLRQWSVGRLACVGDAAHSTTPHLGQGVNLALLDALAVAGAVDAAARIGGGIPAALARATEDRKRQTMWSWRLSNLLGPVFQNEGRWLGVARDWVLPWLPRLPVVGGLMVGTMAGLRTGPVSGLRVVGVR